MSAKQVNWEKISGSLSNLSKRWWGASIALQILIVVCNIAMVLNGSLVQPLFFIVAALSMAYVLTQWQSDVLKRVSDSVKRKFEFLDGLGWKISAKETSDLLATIPKKVVEAAKSSSSNQFFDSSIPPSSIRLLQNLEESSWWTKHLADSMMKITSTICAVIFVIATSTLIVGLETVVNQPLAIVVAKVAVSIIVFIFSGGYFRMSFEYSRMAKEAEKIENQAVKLLVDKDTSEITALKALHEYQIIRAGAPQLPTWIWSLRQVRLNEAWNLRRDLEKS